MSRWFVALLSLGLLAGAPACGDNTGGPDPDGMGLADSTMDLGAPDSEVADGPGGDVTTTDGPQADGPGSDGPQADGPGSDGPGSDGPQGDGPGSDGPQADGPGSDGPSADGPSADGPSADGPAADAPPGDGPAPDAPLTDAPLLTDAPIKPDTSPVLVCYTVTPKAGSNKTAVTLTLGGNAFEVGAKVALVDLVTKKTLQLGVASVSDTNSDGVHDQAVIMVPLGTAQGLYSVAVTNPTSAKTVSCGTYASTAQSPPTLTSVVPDTAWEGDSTDSVLSDQKISLAGTGFEPTPTVRFVNVATKKVYQASTVGYISSTSLTSVCPSESLAMPVGDYYVDVINPSLLWARWTVSGKPGIFKVTATPPPRIDDVSPFKIPANAGGGVPAETVVITGEHFNATSKVVLMLPGGGTMDLTSSVTSIKLPATGKDTITFTWDNTVLKLAVGIYPLRVINPDKQYDTFYSMLVENAAPGKLNADTWKLVGNLIHPRERHASVEGFDVFGNSYIYTVGGTSLPSSGNLSTRPRPVLRSTEIVEVDAFGTAQSTSKLARQLDATVNLAIMDPKHDTLRVPSLLGAKRTGLTLVRAGMYLYAIGGAASDSWYPAAAGKVSALKSVERARILDYSTRPNLSLPAVKAVTKGLPTGSWYYRVSAVIPGEGESLPSREVAALKSGGKITLNWLPVSGASSYLVYRSPASDGRAGTTRLLAAGLTTTSFSDDGQGALAPAPGRLRGKVLAGGSMPAGDWTYRVTATVSGQTETVAGYRLTLTTGTAGQTIKLAWDPIPNATYALYRTEKVNDTTGKTYLLASGLTGTTYTESAAGGVTTSKPAPDGTAPLPSGSLTRWKTLTPQLGTAREGADAVVVKAVDGNTATTNEPSYIFVVGGRSSNATGSNYLRTTERAQVNPKTGALGSFTVMTGTSGPVQLNQPRAFFPLLSTQGRNKTPSAPPPVAPPCPDNDGDGYTDCACGGKDCDDSDATVYPGAPEICGDGKDQDCDKGCAGGSDLPCGNCKIPDADGDGYNRPACGGNDCNDSDPTIHPGAKEICGDGIDQDCDGKDPACACTNPDKDGDGYKRPGCGGNDCNDSDPTIHPGATEIPCDGIDQDCDGKDPCNNDVLSFQFPSGGPQVLAVNEVERVWSPAVHGPLVLTSGGTALTEEPVHLVVLFGDSSYSYPAKNTGLKSAEVAVVRKNGTLSAWTVQTSKIPGAGPGRHGNDGLLYHDFAFSFQGVLNESLGQDPPTNQIWNNVFRYQIDTKAVGQWTEPVPATFLYGLAPADAYMKHGRVYLSVVRLNAYIFGTAGNVGVDSVAPDGPVTSIERIKQ